MALILLVSEMFQLAQRLVWATLQRIIVRRALSLQHPQTPEEIITWLEDAVTAWNEDPTPFT